MDDITSHMASPKLIKSFC